MAVWGTASLRQRWQSEEHESSLSGTHLLQGLMELHGLEEVALAGPQIQQQGLRHSAQLATLWQDGVHGIVRALDEPIALTGQGLGTDQDVLYGGAN